MIQVLFVCLGNICRSPSAEAVFRDMVAAKNLENRIITDSAGTGAWHVGNPPDERAQLIGKTRNIQMSDLRARQVRSSDFEQFQYILAMDNDNYANLSRMKPDHFNGRLCKMLDFGASEETEVPDPYYGDLSDYEYVFDLLKPASEALLKHIIENDLDR
ncbi:low molecular weight protein-tyrosine-phosphatase [Sneathiella aquimaris]|uniref:low molecular weight protein-tyrosine-phosphatase n=1 Tax=Sneathiella aquimaris TaxID=2599305 RepID=UPI001469EEBB|nr:low molecular weight protein-tyrosine-phosphatase [Sneathiella aquimaris]